jgi:hypothetical protein
MASGSGWTPEASTHSGTSKCGAAHLRKIARKIAAVAQLVERILGKDEVTSSNLVSSFVVVRGDGARKIADWRLF